MVELLIIIIYRNQIQIVKKINWNKLPPCKMNNLRNNFKILQCYKFLKEHIILLLTGLKNIRFISLNLNEIMNKKMIKIMIMI